MRLLTRSDFDGLVSAVLLVEKGVVDSYKFVHPKDVQDGEVEVTNQDVLANIPFVQGCGLWFDHHASESERLEIDKLNPQIASRLATVYTLWRKYDEQRQQLIKQQLDRIVAEPGLSKDVYEIVSKSLG